MSNQKKQGNPVFAQTGKKITAAVISKHLGIVEMASSGEIACFDDLPRGKKQHITKAIRIADLDGPKIRKTLSGMITRSV